MADLLQGGRGRRPHHRHREGGRAAATTVARELETDLGTYAPTKHQWDDEKDQGLDGSFSRNFAQIRDRDCYVVDDTITSGTTMTETIEAIREQGGNPVACVVLADKRGVGDIADVPVSLSCRLFGSGTRVGRSATNEVRSGPS